MPIYLVLPVGMLDADLLHAASHEASRQAVDSLKDIHMRSGWGQAMSIQHAGLRSSAAAQHSEHQA